MKKFLIFFSFLFTINIANAQTTNISVAQSVYKYCEREIPEIKAINSIKANIEDVKNERKLRQCLKNKIIQISSTFIEKKELENLRDVIDNIEKTTKTYIVL